MASPSLKTQAVIPDPHPYYLAVRGLCSELRKALGYGAALLGSQFNQRDSLGKAVYDAGYNLFSELDTALRDFETIIHPTGKPPTQANPEVYMKQLKKLAKTCNAAIHRHQPALMAEQGFWNQIKAAINNVAEKYLGIKEMFKTQKTGLATYNQSFCNQYEKVKAGKIDLEEESPRPKR